MLTSAGILSPHGAPAPPGGVQGQIEATWQVLGAAAKRLIACTYLFVASYAPTWLVSSFTFCNGLQTNDYALQGSRELDLSA